MHIFVWFAFICLLVTGAAGVTIVLLKSREYTGAKLKIQKEHEEVISNFRENAGVFIGLYEPMHMIREGRLRDTTSVFADWGARMSELENTPDLLRFWETSYSDYESWDRTESARKAIELLALTQEAGVRRSDETEVTIDNGTSYYYNINDEGSIEPGSVAMVDIPYWSQNNTVLEKGQLSITAETAD